MKYIVSNEQDMQNLVLQVLSKLGNPITRFDGAVVLALNGDLGAGKTTFTKALAKVLGITEHITSPTFVIQKSYNIPTCETSNVSHTKLVHIDAYRLQNAEDATVLDLENTADNPRNLVVIEWVENMKGAVPSGAIKIDFTYIDETTREITIQDSL